MPALPAACAAPSTDGRDTEPVVTSVNDRAVRISVKHVAMIICRTRRWETLAVEYDIGRVVDSYVDAPGECAQD
jgi:hypothetical protein